MSNLGQLIPQGGGDVIPLLRDRLTIGRRESCDICLRFANVSGVHCELAFKNGCWTIEDLKSSNGVKVNGDKVEKKVLHPGDRINVSKHEFVIDYALSASKETMEKMMEEVDEVIQRPLLEKAGLSHPPRAPARPGSSGKLNLPPLKFADIDDDDD